MSDLLPMCSKFKLESIQGGIWYNLYDTLEQLYGLTIGVISLVDYQRYDTTCTSVTVY